MAKRASGESSVTIDGKTYRLRLDFAAIAEIEDRCNAGIATVFQRMAGKDQRLKEVVIIVTEMLRSGGHKKITDDDVVQMLAGLDAKALGEALGRTIEATLGGGDEGNRKAPAKKKTAGGRGRTTRR